MQKIPRKAVTQISDKCSSLPFCGLMDERQDPDPALDLYI